MGKGKPELKGKAVGRKPSGESRPNLVVEGVVGCGVKNFLIIVLYKHCISRSSSSSSSSSSIRESCLAGRLERG